MCLNCGCGEPGDNHGDPLNLTRSRLTLIATRNKSSLKIQAMNILATLLGDITKENPLGSDKMEVKLTRIKVKPEMKAEYVKRTRTKRATQES